MANYNITVSLGQKNGEDLLFIVETNNDVPGIGTSTDPWGPLDSGDTVSFIVSGAVGTNDSVTLTGINTTFWTTSSTTATYNANTTGVLTVAGTGAPDDAITFTSGGSSPASYLAYFSNSAPAITAPTASNVTVDNPNTQTYTATFNLSDAGSGGTLEYSIEKNDSTPDVWIAASSDTQTQFTATFSRSNPAGTIYAQARRSATDVSSIVSVAGTGFIAPDKVVNTISDILIGDSVTSVNIPITNGDTLTVYHAKDGGTTLDSVSGAGTSTANLVISSNLPTAGNSLTVYLYGQRLTTTGGDGNLYALDSPNNTVVITRAVAPVISSVTNDNAEASSVTATINLSSTGSGGTLEYAQSLTPSLPSTGWQTGNTFSHPRGTTRFYWASRDRNSVGTFDGATQYIGYIDSDTTVSTPNILMDSADSSASIVVSNVTSGEEYQVRNSTGATQYESAVASGTSVTITQTSGLPTDGNTLTYKIYSKRAFSIGGNDQYVDTGTSFTITKIVKPVVSNTQTIPTTEAISIDVTIALTSNGSGGTLEYNVSTTTTVPTSGWQASSTVTIDRGSSYYFWARQAEGYEDRNDSAILASYLFPDTAIYATDTDFYIVASDTSATVTVAGVARSTDLVAVRVDNGSTNLATRSGNGDITFSSSLPVNNNDKVVYEFFVQRPTSTGGDGTTWYQTNDLFKVTRYTDPIYSIAAPDSVNEGSSGSISVTTQNVGTATLYWRAEPTNEFVVSEGSVSISSDTGSFSVTPSADGITEGDWISTVYLYDDSARSNIVAYDIFTINDASTGTTGLYGLEVYNSTGTKIVSIADRLVRFVLKGTITVSAYSTSSNITVTGMENNDSWNIYAVPQNTAAIDITYNKYSGYFTITSRTGISLTVDYWVLRS